MIGIYSLRAVLKSLSLGENSDNQRLRVPLFEFPSLRVMLEPSTCERPLKSGSFKAVLLRTWGVIFTLGETSLGGLI
jgi:hypothetical protein